MNETERDAIAERAERATPGPWHTTETQEDTPVVYVDHESIEGAANVLVEADWGTNADAEFIAHARSDVPALLDALRAAEERAAEAVGLLRGLDYVIGLVSEKPNKAATDDERAKITAAITEARTFLAAPR